MAKTRNVTKQSLEDEVQSALKWLKSHSTKSTLEGMARYAIPSDKAFGVAYKDMKVLGRLLGRDHELAAALWDTGVYEARLVASFVADPSQVTPAQMDRWCKDFDNWAICDTMCFNLFDRTPHAWAKVTQWSSSKDEFVKRTAFALLWSLSVHDKRAGNEPSRAWFSSSAPPTTNETSSRRPGTWPCAQSANVIALSIPPQYRSPVASRAHATPRRVG